MISEGKALLKPVFVCCLWKETDKLFLLLKGALMSVVMVRNIHSHKYFLLAVFHCLGVSSVFFFFFYSAHSKLCSCCDSLLVEGLEKSSLANCDVVVGSSQSPQLKGKGKLSSLGKIFKPWKWRKKRTSDKFQDLSKGISPFINRI